jgi:hypothetical protein
MVIPRRPPGKEPAIDTRHLVRTVRPDHGLAVAVPAFAAAAAAALVVAAGVRGIDWPAQDFRAQYFRDHGFAIVNYSWYGGHPLPGYSLVTPAISSLVGTRVLAVAAAFAATLLFGRIVRRVHLERAGLATWVFGAGTLVDVIIGRTTYLTGVAVALGAVLAAVCARRGVAVVLAAACGATSPVAGAFLVLAIAAWWWPRRRDGAALGTAAALVAATALPMVLPRLRYAQGGTFPFELENVVIVVLAVAAVFVAVPPGNREIRAGAVLVAMTAAALLVIPTPLGANLVRLPLSFAPALIVATAPTLRRAALAAVPLVAWLWVPAVWTVVAQPSAASADQAFYRPLEAFFDARLDAPTRVEVPLTEWRRETSQIGGDALLARGWERQVDIDVNHVFYDGSLDASTYRRWLLDNGVRFVALPDAPLDPSADAEAELLAAGLPYLQEVWRSPDWRVWEVIDSTGLVATSGARVTEIDGDRVVVAVDRPGRHVVRLRQPDRLEVVRPQDGSVTIGENGAGWLVLRADRAGSVELQGRW